MYSQRCYVRYSIRIAVSMPVVQGELGTPVCAELERENCCMKSFKPHIFWTEIKRCKTIMLIPKRSLHSRTESKATPKRAKIESPVGEVSN